MEAISKLVQNYTSTFQQCLLAKEPAQHAKSLPDSFQKNLLLFLLEPHTKEYKQNLKNKYSINGALLEAIDKWKIHSKIVKATTTDQIKYIVEKFIKDNSGAYNYAKPAQFHSAADQGKADQGHSLPSILKPIKSLQQWTTEQLAKNEDIIGGLTKQAILSVSQQRLMKLKLSAKEQFLSLPYIRQYPDKFAVEFVKSFYEQQLKNNKNYQISSIYLNNLSRSQFMHLKDAIPALVNKDEYLRLWFSHSYDDILQPYKKTDLTISQKDQKRKILVQILKDLDHLKTNKTKSMKNNILKQLLLLDVSREEVDKALFIQYVRDNPNSNSFENQKVRQKKYEAKSKSSYYQENIDLYISPQTNSTGQDQLIKDCIQRLFKKSKSEETLKQLQQYFDVSLLNKIYAAVKLSQGGKLQDYQNYLSPQQLKKLREQRQITILDSNKRKWKAHDIVTLKIRVKNIKDIHVQVYKLDLEKHFIENCGDIDQTQNLSYLQPNSSYHFTTNNQNPYLINVYDLKIEGVPTGRGVWIVELEGQGISSRAFIRKGAIANVTSTNSAGTQIKFYDDSGVQIKDYSLWMDGKKHNVQSGFIIPYGENDVNVSLSLVKDGYADQYQVYVPRESYYLDMSYIYNTETFIVGSKAKILLHPRLSSSFDRSMQVSFKLLQKVKILVTLTNNLGIKSTIDFDNVQFKATQDYLLQFPIQSYTCKIQISVTAKVKKYNQKQQQLASGHTIDINLSEGNTNFLDLYIRKVGHGYNLYLLGKNGQQIPRTQVIVDVQGRGRYQPQTQNLMTSKQGFVTLGNLKDIQKITARVNLKSGVISREWSFNNQSQYQLLSGSIYRHGDQIILPPIQKQKFNLWRTSQSTGSYTQNLSNKVQFSDAKMSIKGLPVGQYVLQFVQTDRTVSFRVISGKKWQNQYKIYDEVKSTLYEIDQNQNNNISLGTATFKNQQDKTIVQIPVKSTYDIKKDQSFRAHLLVSNFVIPNFTGRFDLNNVIGLRQPKTQYFKTSQSQYYNNKKLSQESSYVVNRRNQTKYIGNNLQKPRVFLKRIQVRDTTQSQEVLNAQEAYQRNITMSRMADQKYYAQKCAPYGGGGGRVHGSLSQSVPFVNPMDITTHNNFLSLPGSIVSNQKGDVLRFQVPAGYSHFQCCAFSNSSAVLKKFDYSVEKIQKKSLSHTGIQKSAKDAAWTMSRQVYKVQKGQNTKVGRDSVWSAIGLSNVVGFAKIKGATLQDWVANWNTYSQQQKLKTYDDKVCHELNTYIKYNDRSFFDKIVQPFIKNKVNKTFVDYCLLQSQQALKWSQIAQFQTLNQFQKVLLVHQLVKAGKNEQAQNIAASMQNQNKANRIMFEQFKKQFDTVITAKLTEEAKVAPASSRARAPVALMSAVQSKPRMMMMQQQCAPMMEMDLCMAQSEMKCQQAQQCLALDDFDGGYNDRAKFNQPFKQMQKTKQYTQTTYSKLKYPHQSQNLVSASPFWTSAAQHFINGKGDFVSQNFMYLTTAVEFTLASCFIPNQKLLQYDLKNNEGDNSVSIGANSSFLIFVREVKSLPFEKKFGVLLNQRFFNPDDRYYYEDDGTRIEKQVQQFIVRRPYCLQTLITNTSGTRLQLQLLIDIPEGSVPLKSHENTQIQSTNLEPYSTLSFERYFYFPSVGGYNMYPANACRGSSVIAKAQQLNNITVLQAQTIKKLDTLQNILKSGQKQAILQYLRNKNIFDSKIFDPSNIFWMLKDKQFFLKVIQVLRIRKYYLSQIWMFGYYHNDLATIAQLQESQQFQNHQNVLKNLPIFQYFPYYSSRAHKFLNQNKSTIRNQQFKKTYFCFLFASLFNEPSSSRARVAFIYYLLLQDRIDQANTLLSQVDEASKQAHRLQFDYIQCFIDMYKGYPSFAKSRTISKKYVDYPIKAWQKLFKQISDTLKEYDSIQVAEQKKVVEYSTTVLNQGNQVKISIPADTRVQVCFYDVNLQLYFSNFPFTDLQNFSSNIVPNTVKVYEVSNQSRQQKLLRDKAMKDCFIQVFSSTSGLKRKKITSFLWSNPSIKIKIKQDSGYAQVFYESKKQAGCYCKVYQMKNGQSKFYRDGYTDITGTFKYALADLEGVTQFAILFVTDYGAVVERVKPPSQQAYLA